MRSLVLCAAALLSLAVSVAAEDKVLFDFEGAGSAKDWAPLAVEGGKFPGAQEPAASLDLAAEGATCGKLALRITFDGGRWPAVTTTALPLTDNWVAAKFTSLRADVTVPRTCLVGLRVVTEKRARDAGYAWVVTKICQPGRNEIAQALGGWWTGMTADEGKILALDVFMYNPRKGESISVDNIRLSTDRVPSGGRPARFEVLGADYTVTDLAGLMRKVKDQWKPPVDKPIEEVEAAFRAKYAELKAAHPGAVLSILRDGEKGYDPAAPDKEYKGWMMRHINSHGPDCALNERAANIKGWGWQECFMRHRSMILQADFSFIPKGADILAAQLILTRTGPAAREGERTPYRPNVWAAEPVNRPWVETEVNAYEYAKDKFWKSVGGMYPESYEGDDPDFRPVYLAHGPSTGEVNAWDFAEAMKWFTDGKHPNYGFFIHGDSTDYIQVLTSEAKDVKKRPTIMLIYDPK